jgi:hypothetical protein
MIEKISSKKYVLIVFVIITITALLGGFIFGFYSGKNSVINEIAHFKKVSLELSSDEVMTELAEMFPEKLDYIELLAWQSSRLDYTDSVNIRHTNPIAILNFGIGRCGEFAILYTAICLANDIPARLVSDLVVDHAWTEINPSKDGETWIHVDPTECCTRIASGVSIYQEPATVNHPLLYSNYWGSDFRMIFAFQVTEGNELLIVERTALYSK